MVESSFSEPIAIQLLGTFQAQRGNTPLPSLHLREGERLLVYFVLHSSESVSSKELAHRFWPFEAQMNPGEQGDYPSVRQALRSLRQALGPDAERITRPQRTAVRFDVSGMNIDVFTFDRLVRVQDATEWPAAYAEAVELYRGPLLASWNEPWLVAPRKRRQRDYETLLRQLTQRAMQAKQHFEAERWLRLLLEAVPDDEDARRDLSSLRATTTLGSPEAKPAREEIRVVGEAAGRDELVSEEGSTPEAETLTLEVAGGAVPLLSRFYIAREADTLFGEALIRRDSIVLLKGTRQVGKTSLLARGLHTVRQTDVRTVVTDFQKINAAEFATPDTLYRTLAASIAFQLAVPVSPRDVWDEDFGPNLNFERFLCLHVLPTFSQPVIWAMDEADRLLACTFGSEVFGLFRSWYNERSLNPQSVLNHLTIVIAYATEAHLFISDLNQSPFNVGTRLTLSDFTLQQVRELNQRYHSPLQEGELVSLQEMLGGQPYLIRRAFDQITRGVPLSHLLAEGDDEDGVFGDHLRRLWLSLGRATHLLDVLRSQIVDHCPPAPDDFYRLRAAGVLAGSGAQNAVFRCRLYKTYFARQFEQAS